MLHELDYDDSDAPAIGLVPPGVTWEDVYDHIKISHHPLLVALDDGAAHAGAYWDGTKMIVAEVSRRVAFIAPVVVMPGEEELPALAEGALRVLRGQETARTYA